MRGVALEDLTWSDAEKVLTRQSVVVIPLGAAAKEHGHHLPLNNDFRMAQYLSTEVMRSADVVVAPTVNFSFYPDFLEYPGSISLSLNTATACIAEICQSLARFGPKRFYVLNTGISTLKALRPAAELILRDGALLHFTNLHLALDQVSKELGEQEGGSHADEIETSIMLHIAPETVDMTKATKDFDAAAIGPLTRSIEKRNECSYSPSGVWGDPILASATKGERVVQSLLDSILKDIENLRGAELPATSIGN